MTRPPPPPPRRRASAGETLRRIVEREEGDRFDPERQAREPRATKAHHFAVNASDDTAKEAPIANAGEAHSVRTPGEAHGYALFRMWYGAYGSDFVYVWADGFESAFEELVEWLDDNAPGALLTLDDSDLKEAAEDLGIPWKSHWPDWEDEKFESVVQHAEADLTTIGHTTLQHGTHIASYEWGGDEIETGSDEWWTVYERSLQEEHEERRVVAEQFDIVRGVIKSPGKFEGEPAYVPFLWGVVLEGGGEEFEVDGQTVSEIEVESDNEYAFPELHGMSKVWLWEDEQGFVHSKEAGERPDEDYEENARASAWDHNDLRDSDGKRYMLRFLPYSETVSGEPSRTVIGYGQRYEHGSLEEFFHTRQESQRRLRFLAEARVIEWAEIFQMDGGTLVDEWKDKEPGYEENARGKLTKADVERMFREEVLPHIRATYEKDGRVDGPARSQAWNDYTDALHKDGMITRHQADTWSNPF